MYKPYEIISKLPPAISAELFAHLMEKEPMLVKATIGTLCKQRKLRPVFIERKPKTERVAWMQEALGRKQNEGVAAHFLQIWLVSAHSNLLCDFLDGLGIAHDENGTIEELPSAPDKAKLLPVVDSLFAKHDAAVVAVYLHAFQSVDEEGWESLEGLLKEDARLKL
jgi:hypothetical protein